MNDIKIPTVLTQQDIDKIKTSTKDNISLGVRKTRLTGFYVICVYLIIGYFIGFSISSTKETERVFQLLNSLILGYGIAIVLLPNIIGLTNVKNLYYYEYSEANSTVIHNCTAYVNMENMEPWKQYMEEVKKQGRQLTNHECNLIINDWNNLIT